MTAPREVTAETLTDEEIRRLRDHLLRESGNQMTEDTDATGTALNSKDSTMRAICREHCAEIINARAKAGR